MTEYVRTSATIENRPVDGIRYRSSRRKARTALVLFADQDNLVLKRTEQPEFYRLAKDRWLRLVKASVKSVTASDVDGWVTKGGGLFGDS